MSRLTTADLEVLEAFLNRNDRAGFYIKCYDLTKCIDPEGARLALLQAHISSYSGFLGGGALIGNAIAKFSNPEKYTVTLDDFSLEIARALFDNVKEKVGRGESGALAKSEIFDSDNAVWKEKGLFEYFPGRLIQVPISGIAEFFSAGSVSAVLSGIQLIPIRLVPAQLGST